MALHYDWTKTPNHESLDHSIKYTAAMATMVLGVGDLATAKGHAEFALRLKTYEAWFGPLLVDNEGHGVGLSTYAEQVRGLRTNVTLEPRAKWFKRMSERYLQEQMA